MDVEKGRPEEAVREKLRARLEELKKSKGAVVMAHYYQRPEIQDVADYIGDSLALAQQAAKLKDAKIIVLCGVNFMAETAKIISPEKKVLIPAPEAGCSLADSCPAEEFEVFVKQHPDHTVVSYVNTSVGVKALSDILVTSSNAKKIIDSLPADEKIIFGPDRNLGNYINSMTGREMLLWNGACHVHEKFSLEKILVLKKEHPGALVLAHPECRRPLLMAADKVGSTAALIDFATNSKAKKFIVATESGIIHGLRKKCPDKEFIPAPPEDPGCACNECAYMKMITLPMLVECLENESPEVIIDPDLAAKARKSINRMLELS